MCSHGQLLLVPRVCMRGTGCAAMHPSFQACLFSTQVHAFGLCLTTRTHALPHTGMQVRVHHGLLETNAEGMARDRLWVTDFRNRKVRTWTAS